jgi:hypothetical protein
MKVGSAAGAGLEVREDPDNHGWLFDGGDNFEVAATLRAARAALGEALNLEAFGDCRNALDLVNTYTPYTSTDMVRAQRELEARRIVGSSILF